MKLSGSTRFALLAAGLSLVTTLVLCVVLFVRPRSSILDPRSPIPDPRSSYAGPYRNVDPAVRYVPDSLCAGCHPDIATSYAGHPMGRSLLSVARAEAAPPAGIATNAFEALGSHFLVERERGRVLHRRTRLDQAGRPVAEQEWEVHYVIGSGNRGYSYLTDRDGYLFQTPISWYSQKQVWDLSPGFGPSLLTGRAVLPDCLFCHANRANYVEGSVNHYTQPVFDGYAIGCQRCHGPGELHTAGPGKGSEGIDPTVVNPKHLAADLRDAVCEQCHLQGAARSLVRGRGLYDFRPGLPLGLFWSVFLRAPEAGKDRKAIGQVEQMYQSRCFQGSEGPGRLGCISCHDPHKRPAADERLAYYRDRCLHCHSEKGCSLPVAVRREQQQDNCTACHMPRYGAVDIPHTATTDHRILRGGKSVPPEDVRPTRADVLPVVSFYRGRQGVDDSEDERDRAVILVRLALAGDASAARVVRHALAVLEAALQRDPDDQVAGEARGYALALQDRSTEALTAFQAVLAKAPDRELALVGAATMAEALGQTEGALGYWRRAVAANPLSPGYRRSLVLLLVKKGMWQEVQPECLAWLRLDPINADPRIARVQYLLAAGNKDEARAEFARIEALSPTNLRELRIRFAKKLR